MYVCIFYLLITSKNTQDFLVSQGTVGSYTLFSAAESFSNLNTIEVLHNTRAECIRLNSIDYPEKGQPYGERAKQATIALVFGTGKCRIYLLKRTTIAPMTSPFLKSFFGLEG